MSNSINSPNTQRGVATIFVSMVLLTLITMKVLSDYSLSSMHLKLVGNLQTREEAIASAERAIELVVSGTFWNPAVAQTIPVDIDNDTVNDYTVDIAAPTCLRATKANITTASSVNMPGLSVVSAYNTVWILDATARDLSNMGTQVRVRQGVRLLLSESNKNLYCP